MRAHGLALDPPAGWDVRITRRRPDPGETTHPVLHACTRRLPFSRGDYGSGAVDLLGADDAFVALVEFDAAAAGSALHDPEGLPRPRAAQFSPRQLHRSLPHQSGCQWFFHVGARAFSLYVVLGAHERRAVLAPRVEALLARLHVDPQEAA